MNVVEVEENTFGDSLPLTYDAELIAAYWRRRPGAVARRILQLLSIAGGFLSKLALDAIQGTIKANEVARAIELREIVTSLGPAYIKLGQARTVTTNSTSGFFVSQSPVLSHIKIISYRTEPNNDHLTTRVMPRPFPAAGALDPAGPAQPLRHARAAEALRQGAIVPERRGHEPDPARAGRPLDGLLR